VGTAQSLAFVLAPAEVSTLLLLDSRSLHQLISSFKQSGMDARLAASLTACATLLCPLSLGGLLDMLSWLIPILSGIRPDGIRLWQHQEALLLICLTVAISVGIAGATLYLVTTHKNLRFHSRSSTVSFHSCVVHDVVHVSSSTGAPLIAEKHRPRLGVFSANAHICSPRRARVSELSAFKVFGRKRTQFRSFHPPSNTQGFANAVAKFL
jgi:hypothetical protein